VATPPAAATAPCTNDSWLLKLNAFADWKTTTFPGQNPKVGGKRQKAKGLK